jgi:hypothetical protein
LDIRFCATTGSPLADHGKRMLAFRVLAAGGWKDFNTGVRIKARTNSWQ